MQSQQYLQTEPPEKSHFMKENGWPLIITIFTFLTTVFSFIAALLGKLLVVGFNWIMGGIGIFMLIILIAVVWYDTGSRRKQKERYEKDTAAIKAQHATQIAEMINVVELHKKTYLKLIESDRIEHAQWQERVVTTIEQHNATLAREQQESLDALSKSFNDAITATNTALTDQIKYQFKLCTDWQNTHMIIHEKQEEYNRYYMKEHEKKLHATQRQELSFDNQTPI